MGSFDATGPEIVMLTSSLAVHGSQGHVPEVVLRGPVVIPKTFLGPEMA